MILKLIVLVVVLSTAILSLADEVTDSQREECKQITSCSSCLLKSFCVWCITKSKCTKQDCGNDNVIYPQGISAIMSGSSFCPKVVKSEVWTIKSGKTESVIVKITQIHLYMAFTNWKCKIVVDNEETVVNAMLIGNNVFCKPVLFENKSNSPYVNGSVSVQWDYSKSFDGAVPLEVCRCDLDPKCSACK